MHRLLLLVSALLWSASPSTHWTPPQHFSFFWQLQGTPAVHDVAVTDMDGFENSPETVARFHAAGQKAICYIDAGTWEQWRSDAASFPASTRGKSNGWPGEAWLDIRQLATLEPILAARIRTCHDKDFDAVEPDNIDGYSNSTGFPLTAADQIIFNKWIAEQVHAEGMAVFLKNDGDQARALEPFFDGVVSEECFQFHECDAFAPFLRAGKPVLEIEYKASLYPAFCAPAKTAHITAALFGKALDGKLYTPCPA